LQEFSPDSFGTSLALNPYAPEHMPQPFRDPAVRARRRSTFAAASRPRIVAIGGGTGLPAVLSGIADAFDERPRPVSALTGVVTVTDDGGSSGRLRREAGMLPPGDVRNCLVALAPDSPLKQLLQHRFTAAPSLRGHALGNLLLAALVEVTGDFCDAIDQLATLMRLRGRVLPATVDHVSLVGEFDGGRIICGETAIVAERRPIRRLHLDRPAHPVPRVIDAIAHADLIVVGPGSLYTSILPNLLVDGIAAAIAASPAVRVFVGNLMTEPGETDGFSLEQHLGVIAEHTGKDLFDCVLVNRRAPSPDAIARYANQSALPIEIGHPAANTIGRARVVRRNLARETHQGKVRHSPGALARALLQIASERQTRAARATA
jgi:uncharacterized cofD-like protein